jgi:hypothetical protein
LARSAGVGAQLTSQCSQVNSLTSLLPSQPPCMSRQPCPVALLVRSAPTLHGSIPSPQDACMIVGFEFRQQIMRVRNRERGASIRGGAWAIRRSDGPSFLLRIATAVFAGVKRWRQRKTTFHPGRSSTRDSGWKCTVFQLVPHAIASHRRTK